MVSTLRRAVPALLSVSFIYAGSAAAQNYPLRSIRIIIPFAAGGGADVVFRMLTPPLSENLGQQVVIDNRPGGGATIGMDLVSKAAPDGYTLGVANVPFGVNPFILSNLPYDTEKDFEFYDWLGVVVPAGTPGQVVLKLKTPYRDGTSHIDCRRWNSCNGWPPWCRARPISSAFGCWRLRQTAGGDCARSRADDTAHAADARAWRGRVWLGAVVETCSTSILSVAGGRVDV